MKHITTERFDRAFKSFTLQIQRTFKKQIQFLINDIRHPSLHAKKYDESSGIWQARVNDSVRFYFRIEGDTYILINIRKHGK